MKSNKVVSDYFLRLTVVGMSVVGFSSNAFAQDSSLINYSTEKVLTLQDVVNRLEGNPALIAIDEKVKSYSAYSKSARSWEAPTITGGFWMVPYVMMPNPEDAGMNNGGGALMLGIQQMIPNPGKQKAEQNYMNSMGAVEKTTQSFERREMIREAKKAYVEWIILEKKANVLEESARLLNLMIKSGEIGYTYNQNILSRIYKAKSELFKLHNLLVMTRNEIRMKNVMLNTVMNIDKKAVYKIDTNYTILNYEILDIDTAALSTHRSDLQNVDASFKALESRRKFELSKRKPEFGVQAAHMNGLAGMPDQFNLMGMVTIPIVPWATKGYKANLEGIAYEKRSLSQKKNSLINEAVGKLETLRTELSSRKAQLELYEKNIIPALQKNYNTSLISFEHMNEDMFMTIDAWMTLKMAKIEYLNILSEILSMQADYEREIEN